MTDPTITSHRFMVRRQDGIGPHPDDLPCASCGATKAMHQRPTCTGALNIAGQHFACELQPPHHGWGHSNREAQAVWQ